MAEAPLPVYVISLARATERRAVIDAEFKKLGFDYQIFDGVDGKAEMAHLLQKTDQKAWARYMGAPLSAGHLGCYASHVTLWDQIGKGTDEIALICEDDIVFHDDFAQALDQALAVSAHWDICRFAKIRAKGAVSQGQIGPYRLNAYWGPFTGNACYLIKRDLAARLAQEFWPIRRAHDHELNRFFHYDFRLRGLEPFAAHPDDKSESFITGQSMSEARKFPRWKRLPHYLHKAANYVRRVWWLAENGELTQPQHQLNGAKE